MTNDEHNKACCSLPPVSSSDYTPQGTFEVIAGLNCYVVGPKDAEKVLVCVYDIFGYYPQVKQGADLLATQGYRVVIPDFFRGKPMSSTAFPAYSSPLKAFPSLKDEDKAELMSFITHTANFQTRAPDLLSIATALRSTGAAKLGAYGLCWGGKLVILSAGAFDAIAQIHPARMDPKDAEGVNVPIASYISDDESREAQEGLREVMAGKAVGGVCDFQWYEGMHHGFAGSRADLKDPNVYKNFQDVYNRLASFFKKTL
ncbi:hypothetical protein HK104_009453 [Borealophlyctis nickersoniae]|nr:hypothetical protein HK104_009453 [Borealophlyctis nickersoniae]